MKGDSGREVRRSTKGSSRIQAVDGLDERDVEFEGSRTGKQIASRRYRRYRSSLRDSNLI
jgi:hypothetical protein